MTVWDILCVVNTVAAANHKYRVRRKYDRIPFNHRPDVSVSFHFLFLRVLIYMLVAFNQLFNDRIYRFFCLFSDGELFDGTGL